jgi:hypothetical protein
LNTKKPDTKNRTETIGAKKKNFVNGNLRLLLYLDDRIWNLDKDNRVGWHIHPLENTKLHEPIEPKSVKEIVATFDLVCGKFVQ